jgi:uncharacterized protein (TIGR03437 family)
MRAKMEIRSVSAALLLPCALLLFGQTSPAQKININLNHDTFVLSNEAPGFLITQLIGAGHGADSPYQALLLLASMPGTSAVLTQEFLNALATCPASSEIFTTTLTQVLANGISVSISTDGTVRYDDVEGSPFAGRYPVISTGSALVQNVRIIHSTDSQAPLNATVVFGPLAGMTTTYNAFAVAYTATGANVPLISGVSNAASGLAAIAPNTWVSVYGSNFAAAGFGDDWSKSIVNGNLPTALDGVSVSVGGIPAYVNYVSPGQINILTPNVAPGNTPVTVTTVAGTSAPVSVTAQQFSPAFFPWPNGQPVATHLDYSWAVKNGAFAGATTVPAKAGEYIILWGTGFGPTMPTAPVGVTIPAGTTYYTANPVYVTIGGVNAPVYGTALASGFGGLYQVVALVPPLPNGDYPLVATVGGVATATTTLTVHN